MITLEQFADIFQRGLNAVLKKNEIQFKIWSNVGKYQKAIRDGNTVTKYINGNLRVSSSANDANDLVMGVNGLTLDFIVPLKRPRTNAKQTAEELAAIQDGQYPFVEEIVNAIDGYFQKAVSTSMPDKDGNSYAVSYQAGTAVGGTVDLLPLVGKALEVSVYIEVYFIEGGVSSKSVKVYVDGISIPYTAARFGRSPVIERDVYADEFVSKSIITSTAIAIDLDFPSTAKGSAGIALDYLFDGEPNVAHFVKVKWGTVKEKNYFMTVNSAVNSSQGITIAGASISLVEVGDNVFSVPRGYQVRKFLFNTAEPDNLTFALSENCTVYIAGKVYSSSDSISVNLKSTDLVYDEDLDLYGVTLVTDRVVNVIRSSAPWIGFYNADTVVMGTWVWNDNILRPDRGMLIPVNFTSNSRSFKAIVYNFNRTTGGFYIEYNTSADGGWETRQRVCDVVNGDTMWVNKKYKTMNFGDSEQVTSVYLYKYLVANAKPEASNG